MPINIYDVPAEQPLMETYVPVPFQEILGAAQMRQQRYDTNVEAATKFAGVLSSLPFTQIRNEVTGEVITDKPASDFYKKFYGDQLAALMEDVQQGKDVRMQTQRLAQHLFNNPDVQTLFMNKKEYDKWSKARIKAKDYFAYQDAALDWTGTTETGGVDPLITAGMPERRDWTKDAKEHLGDLAADQWAWADEGEPEGPFTVWDSGTEKHVDLNKLSRTIYGYTEKDKKGNEIKVPGKIDSWIESPSGQQMTIMWTHQLKGQGLSDKEIRKELYKKHTDFYLASNTEQVFSEKTWKKMPKPTPGAKAAAKKAAQESGVTAPIPAKKIERPDIKSLKDIDIHIAGLNKSITGAQGVVTAYKEWQQYMQNARTLLDNDEISQEYYDSLGAESKVKEKEATEASAQINILKAERDSWQVTETTYLNKAAKEEGYITFEQFKKVLDDKKTKWENEGKGELDYQQAVILETTITRKANGMLRADLKKHPHIIEYAQGTQLPMDNDSRKFMEEMILGAYWNYSWLDGDGNLLNDEERSKLSQSAVVNGKETKSKLIMIGHTPTETGAVQHVFTGHDGKTYHVYATNPALNQDMADRTVMTIAQSDKAAAANLLMQMATIGFIDLVRKMNIPEGTTGAPVYYNKYKIIPHNVRIDKYPNLPDVKHTSWEITFKYIKIDGLGTKVYNDTDLGDLAKHLYADSLIEKARAAEGAEKEEWKKALRFAGLKEDEINDYLK